MKFKKLLLTLLAGSMVISGCKAPVKPTVKAEVIQGKVCFSQTDATKLGVYILSLEGGYK